MLALLLFIAMRWQPELWLQAQVDRQARQRGIDVQYQQLDITGFSARIQHISIRTAALPAPIVLDALSISPAWSMLLKGTGAVDVKAMLSGQSAQAILAWQNKYIEVRDLNADLDVAVLQTFWKQRMSLPVDVSGRLKLSGNVQLDAVTGLPVDGALNALWQQARVDLPMFDKPLGDYELVLKADAKAHWQWSLGGGKAVTLSGSGLLDLSATSSQQWTVRGRLQVQAQPAAKAIAALLGQQAKAFAVSGPLLNARLQPM